MSHCIIVGAGPGISRSLAFRLGRSGSSIGIIARSEASLILLADELTDAGVSTRWRTADAGDEDQLSRAIEELVAEAGACDQLVYNAAAMSPGFGLDLDVDRLHRDFSVNVGGALVATQSVAPSMITAGTGSIVFTGGGLALEPFPEWTSLALGKAALHSLAISLHKELAPHGVHVAVIAVCGIVEPGTDFDPDVIAEQYVRLLTDPQGVEDRESVFQPAGSDALYNDPEGRHVATTLTPHHAL